MTKEILPKNWPDDKVLKETRALVNGYRLKRTLRYNTERDFSKHSESVAEHIFALHFLATYFLSLEDPDHNLDREKIHNLITYHDFGEIIRGDIPYHIKTEEDQKREEEDTEKALSTLPSSLQILARESWQDYKEKRSKEAEFVYALDKIEPLFELFDPINELSLKRTKFSYKDHFQRKFIATENFPVMRRFTEVISKDMLERKVFWENSPSSP